MTAHELVRMGQFLDALNRIEREHRVHIEWQEQLIVSVDRDSDEELIVTLGGETCIELSRVRKTAEVRRA